MEEGVLVQGKASSSFVRFLDRLGGALIEPRKTFYDMLAEKGGIIEPLLLVVLFFGLQGALVGVFLFRLLSPITPFMSFIGAEQSMTLQTFLLTIPVITTVSWVIIALLLWIISAGIAHLCAKYIFKGRGSYTQLLTLYGYASVPSSLVILGMILVGLNVFSFFVFFMFLSIVAAFWTVVILVVAVERCYLIDPGQAFISSFIVPLAVYLAFLALIGWLFLALGGFFL
ncbi:MAG: YIP1 family protein [Nitrososphaerales archaeon]|nr:YIP1 family protein [Nitrososphaerales archaeon]